MTNFLIIAVILICIFTQVFAGYNKNKLIGSILPVIFVCITLFLFISGNVKFNFQNFVLPLVGILGFISAYDSAKTYHEKKIQKEIEKMKAKDISENE